MSTLFISLLTLVLILVSAFLVLIILMQRTSQSGGMGASLGGGAAESAFGSDTNNVLTRGTIYGIVAFFSVAMGLYLMYQAQAADSSEQLAVPAVSELQLDTNTATEVEDTAASDAAETQPSQPAEPLAPAASN
jgi:preprotein translocase subunit SecG